MKFNLNTYYEFHHSGKDTIRKFHVKELPLVPHGLLLDMKFSPDTGPP